MNRLEKLIRANDLRRTRFHLEDGSCMPWRAWCGIPRAALARVRQEAPREPWLTPGVVGHLTVTIRPAWTIFEFGSGLSTPWYAERSAQVVSLEHDSGWHAVVSGQLRESGLTNCDLRLVAIADFPSQIAAFPDSFFDLVVVDGNEIPGVNRLDCLREATAKVKPGGLIVFDDSDRRRYTGWREIVEGWEARRFVGVRSSPFMATETSILRRPIGGIVGAGD